MTNTSVDDDVDESMFEYVAASAMPRAQNTTAGGSSGVVRKTVYEQERDARVNAIIREKGLTILLPPETAGSKAAVTSREALLPSSCVPNTSPSVAVALARSVDASASSRVGVPCDSEASKKVTTPQSAAEEAQRLKDQRYAIFRRNKALNQNALREVDPDTKRYVQIAYTPADGSGGRQYRAGSRGSGRGVGRGNYGNAPNGASRGFRRVVGRAGQGLKRTRD